MIELRFTYELRLTYPVLNDTITVSIIGDWDQKEGTALTIFRKRANRRAYLVARRPVGRSARQAISIPLMRNKQANRYLLIGGNNSHID